MFLVIFQPLLSFETWHWEFRHYIIQLGCVWWRIRWCDSYPAGRWYWDILGQCKQGNILWFFFSFFNLIIQRKHSVVCMLHFIFMSTDSKELHLHLYFTVLPTTVLPTFYIIVWICCWLASPTGMFCCIFLHCIDYTVYVWVLDQA